MDKEEKPSWPETEKEFITWFWKGQNGNNLIKKLNQASNTDRIRREKFPPHIYGIVLKDGVFPFKEQEQWRLCKIGFTHKDTTPESNNRMDQLEKTIPSKYEKKNTLKSNQATAKTFFVVAIGAVDTTEYNDTEKRIREKFGTPVPKDVAKKYGLECPTEWVLTTQRHITRIKGMIQSYTGDGDEIDIFKNIKDKDVPTATKNMFEREWSNTAVFK